MAQVVLSAAIMDICHAGHINLLKRMREAAGKDGKVIMVLHDDKSCYKIKGKFPIQHVAHRRNNVLSTGLVDEVYVTRSTDPGKEFDKIIRDNWDKTMIFMRGDDNLDYPGKHVIDSFEIPSVFVPYTLGVSSTAIRDELILWT